MRITAGSPRTRGLLAAAGVLSAIGATLALLGGDPTANAATVTPAYAALERPYASSDAVADRRITVARMAADNPTMAPQAARVLRTDADATVALIPRRDDQLCLAVMAADGSAALQCLPRAVAETEGLNVGTPGRIVGVVPDGVRSVRFTLTSGATSSFEVTGNVYRAPAEAQSVAFTTASGEHVSPLVAASEFARAARTGG